MCRATTILVIFLCFVVSLKAINRPVYKIVLTQKGYAQFLQYDVVTPPIREFTFCTWIRVYDLANTQSIFTYVANGNVRVIRVWLDSGGQRIKLSINGKVTSQARVDVVKDVWRHICFSYQSDYGAWALYVDSRLVSCEAAKSLNGFVLPGGGSVIIGYGTGTNGESNGFEGEIFGANMILSSTIERNYTLRQDPLYGQKRFPRNKIKKDSNYNNYVVLSDLLNEKIQNSFESSKRNLTKNFIKFQTPFGFIEHGVGLDGTTKQSTLATDNISKEAFDFTVSDFMAKNQDKLDFWNTPKFTFSDMYKSQTTNAAELLKSSTKITPSVSEYETPPPPSSSSTFDNTFDMNDLAIPTPTKSFYTLDNRTFLYDKTSKFKDLPLIETPPPVDQNTKVFGQWSSSKFAGNVLNYLKSINNNFKYRDPLIKRTPQTIPLHKISDSYPYSSDFRLNIIRPPSQFRRRKVVEKKYDIIRRDSQINVQILEDDLRSNIAKMHAETQPKKVEISHRGADRKRELRLPPHNKDSNDSLEEHQYDKSQSIADNSENIKNHRYPSQSESFRFPTPRFQFAKSLENILYDSYNSETQTPSDQDLRKVPAAKFLDLRNKWHNAKSYNNDYTPRKYSVDDSEEIEELRKAYPSVRLRYNPDPNKRKNIIDEEDMFIIQGRKLASEVSNQSYVPKDSVSILKYNHGLLVKNTDKKRMPAKRNMEPNNFNKRVKIGNALNEREVLGNNEKQKKQSFVGGDENIPDIHKYRSETDDENVPPSLGPRVCKNAELYDRVLYVQPDGSIDMTHILSPVREKNNAIEFVIQNYKKCSLTDSAFQKNAMLLIDWSKTPVRLFGGAYPRTTTDLCGFF